MPRLPQALDGCGQEKADPTRPAAHGGLGRRLPVSSPGLGFQRRALLPTVQLQELPWIPPPSSPTPHLWAAEWAGEGAHRGSGNGAGSSSCIHEPQRTWGTEDLLLSLGPLLLVTKVTVLAGSDRCSGSTGTLALPAPECEAGRRPQVWVPTVDGAGQAVQTWAARRAGGQCGGEELSGQAAA